MYARRATVVIADMPPAKLDLWTPLLRALELEHLVVESLKYSEDCAGLKDLYSHPTDQNFRCGVNFPHMCQTTVLVMNQSHPMFLT